LDVSDLDVEVIELMNNRVERFLLPAASGNGRTSSSALSPNSTDLESSLKTVYAIFCMGPQLLSTEYLAN